MKRKMMALFAVVVATAMLLGACSSSAEPSPPDTSAGEPTAAVQTQEVKSDEASTDKTDDKAQPQAQAQDETPAEVPVEDEDDSSDELDNEYDGGDWIDEDDYDTTPAITFDNPAAILGVWNSRMYDRSIFFNEEDEFGYIYFDGDDTVGTFTLGDPGIEMRTYDVFYYGSEGVSETYRVYDNNHIISDNCEMFVRAGYNGDVSSVYDNGARITVTWNTVDGSEAPNLDFVIADANGWLAHFTSEWVEDDGSIEKNYIVPGFFVPMTLKITGADGLDPYELTENLNIRFTIVPLDEEYVETSYNEEFFTKYLTYDEDGNVIISVDFDWGNYRLMSSVDEYDYSDELFGDLFYSDTTGCIYCQWPAYYPDVEVRVFDIYGAEISGYDTYDGESIRMNFNVEPGVYPAYVQIIGYGLEEDESDYEYLDLLFRCYPDANETYYSSEIGLESLGEYWQDTEIGIGSYYIPIAWSEYKIGE